MSIDPCPTAQTYDEWLRRPDVDADRSTAGLQGPHVHRSPSRLGDDRPGNIHGIAGCLAAHGVNIVDLHARVDGSRFALVMEAFLPHDLTPGTIRAELERFGRDHGLEAYVQHENIFLATSEPSPVRVGPVLKQGDAVVPH